MQPGGARSRALACHRVEPPRDRRGRRPGRYLARTAGSPRRNGTRTIVGRVRPIRGSSGEPAAGPPGELGRRGALRGAAHESRPPLTRFAPGRADLQGSGPKAEKLDEPKRFSRSTSSKAVAPPRWLADEMLGRLARYLRFFGQDTEYVRGLSDAEIAHRVLGDRRRLLTRDRALARSVAGTILLPSPYLPEQLRKVREEAPDAGYRVTFDRCSLCNGVLQLWALPTGATPPPGAPSDVIAAGRPVFACSVCGHLYWEGSHTQHIRAQVAEWLPS
jgi:uncharacterized protein